MMKSLKTSRRQDMAHLDMANGPASRFDASFERRRVAGTPSSRRRRVETAMQLALCVTAFAFVAAIICGIGM
jgi:hypothetical protein